MTGEPLRQLHRTYDRAHAARSHHGRSMASEGLSGFDAELVADAGRDVVAEPVGLQRGMSNCSQAARRTLENASTFAATEALLKSEPTTERNCQKTRGLDFTCESGLPTTQSNRSR